LYLFLFLIGVLFLLFFTKVKVIIFYNCQQGQNQLTIKLRSWFGLLRYTIHVPERDEDDSEKMHKRKMAAEDAINSAGDFFSSAEDIKGILGHIGAVHFIMKNFLRKVRLSKFECHTSIGAGDAALTAVLSGGILALQSWIIALLCMYVTCKIVPSYSVTPVFQKPAAGIVLSCIFQFRLGKAILAGIKLFRYWKSIHAESEKDSMQNFAADSNGQTF
jgi:hypothetical protein